MSVAMDIGVVRNGQCVFQLSYPLAHLSNLAVELLRIGEDESGDVWSNKDMSRWIAHSPRAMAGAQRT